MKKLFALIMAIIMVLVIGAAFASEEPTSVIARDAVVETDGVISVANPSEGQTYRLYKLFDADSGANDAITYTLPTGKNSLGDGEAWFELNDNGFVVAKDSTNVDWAKAPEAYTWARDFGVQVGEAIIAGSEVKWENLPYGYYFVDTTLGAYIGVDSANKEAAIHEKNEPPTIDKEIVDVAGATDTLDTGDDTTDPGKGKHEKAIAQIGDPINYKLTIKAKPGAKGYIVTDTISDGLTPPAAAGVVVSVGAENCTVTVEGQVITVAIKDEYLSTLTSETDITIAYAATLNGDAVIGEEGNPNTAKLVWGDKPETNKTEDAAKVYTAQIEIMKTDSSDNPLSGAGFVIKNADDKYYKLDNGSVTWVDDIGAADEHLSNDEGKVASFTGLKNGTYTIVEKTVPAGYNKLDDSTFTVDETVYTNDNLKQESTVINQAGAELPSTGGVGTTIFYVIGGLLIIGAAIVLVARRKAHE